MQADKEELLKVYDEEGNYLGYKEKRSIVHAKRLYHRVVALWVIDLENNSVMLQKRSKNKKAGANQLGVLAGHVVGDDSLIKTVRCEAVEELGIDISYLDIHKLCDFSKKDKNNYCHIYHYYVLSYIPLKRIDVQEEELSRVMYFDYDFLKKCIQENDQRFMIPWDKNHIELFKKLDKVFKNKKDNC